MKRIKKIILIIIAIGVILFLFFKIGDMYAPGSYPYAEEYELNVDENTLINIVNNFKMENPIYLVPERTQLKDGRRDSSDYWYHIYFYYPEENQIVKSWIRQKGKDKVTLAFVGINEGQSLGNWRMINKDFSTLENREQKRIFEERILRKVEERVSSRK